MTGLCHPRFESERLRMRPQSAADAEALFEAYSDAELMTWWSSAPHTSVDRTRAYLAERSGFGTWRGWVMVTRVGEEVVGTLAAMPVREGVAEIGYLVLRRYWGQGYAREGVSRLLDLLFAKEDYRRVKADTDPDNAASNALLTHLGFTMEGRLRGEWQTHIGVRDSFIWGLLASEWRR